MARLEEKKNEFLEGSPTLNVLKVEFPEMWWVKKVKLIDHVYFYCYFLADDSFCSSWNSQLALKCCRWLTILFINHNSRVCGNTFCEYLLYAYPVLLFQYLSLLQFFLTSQENEDLFAHLIV